MKAERRHELQQNTLAKVITKAPTFWQEFGGRGLLFAVAALAVVLLVRYRITSSRAAAAAAADNLTQARETIVQLQNSGMMQMPPQELASRRRSLFSEAGQAIDQVSELADTPTLQSEGLIAKGDLNWTLANLPELPGASTQPNLQVTRDPKDLIKAAEDAYQMVLSKYSGQEAAAIAARFGLAAIAENRGDWDAAKKQYETVASTANVPQAYLEQARIRLQKLPELQQPVKIEMPTTVPTLTDFPTTQQQMAALPPTIAAPTTQGSPTTKPTPPGIAPTPPKPPATAPKPAPTTSPR